jgi:hypothetical protein
MVVPHVLVFLIISQLQKDVYATTASNEFGSVGSP